MAAGCSSVAIMDVGIGRGIQMVSLLRELAHVPGLENVTITGIEPFADAIPFATRMITEAAQSLPFKVSLKIVEGFAENMDATGLKAALPALHDKLIVNASLAIHHIPATAQREQFFKTIKQLSPAGIVLTEPDTDHMTGNWKQRTKNAWTHYGAVFNTIDSLPVAEAEKRGLKMFFGREIKDVVGAPDEQRYERHEPASRWTGYGRGIGYGVMPGLEAPDALASNDTFGIGVNANGLLMSRHSTPILAVIPLTPQN
jgi:hypothetical protein